MAFGGQETIRALSRRLGVGLAVAAVSVTAPAAVSAAEPAELVGALHEHSGYSDGWPGSRPSTYFASGRSFGLDFMGSGEHSDSLDLPGVLNEACLDPLVAPDCALADKEEPENSFRKWDATLEQARAASSDTFTAFRGFEWSSNRYGHVNVYLSERYTRANTDGGLVTLDSFWSWFTRPPALGGGGDGVAVFNHPGAKKLAEDDPAFNWNDFAYVPEADERMVGIEVFNDRRDYGSAGPYPEGAYVRALDRGWHVGAVGAEDLGHDRADDWGGPDRAKTVILAYGRSEQALRAALLARRFYATRRTDVRLRYTVDGRPMGSRLAPVAGRRLDVRATVNDPDATLELVTSGGRVVASRVGKLSVRVRAAPSERYYFVRARAAGEMIAYSSPVWVRARPKRGPAGGEWLAGDLHVHTCYSHDAYCPPDDDNTGPDDFYALSLSPGGRFLEAAQRGLDFLAITDHNDVRSASDPDFGSFGVIGLPGYENSLRGHAQMLGATRVYGNGDASASAVSELAEALRADGGAVQANHPAYRLEQPFDSCQDTAVLDWSYGYEVRPDVIEAWNPTSSTQAAERYLECWLERGARVGLTGGSDSHWLATAAAQGVGSPTTWVLARERSRAAILEAIRAGRTTVSRAPPGQGGGPLLLEADRDGDGVYESTSGDTVPPGTPMRVVVVDGVRVGAVVRVRANGATVLEQPLPPDGELEFTAPAERGWVRAALLLPDTDADAAADAPSGCEPNGAAISTCAYDRLVAGLTSPIYLRR